MIPRHRPDYPSLGPLVANFIEKNLVFGPGDLRGLPAKLDDEKKALLWMMYLVYPPGHPQAGRRCFQRVGLSMAKGLAKTEFAAWIAACELHPDAPVRCNGFDRYGRPLGTGVTDPYIPMVAYTEEQSDELCYGTLKVVLEEGPLREDFDIGLERIMRKRGDGRAVSLATAPNARDGARTTWSICDETHWWTSNRLKQAHRTMLANLPKRRAADAWGLETTTAPEPGAGSVAEGAMEYAKAVAEGRVTESRFFFFHRQSSDNHDYTTEEGFRSAVIEASGSAASWRNIDAIVELWHDPTSDRAYLERVWCNRLVKGSSQAFDIMAWDKLTTADFPVNDGDLITLGFDGAQYNDSTGLVATHVETGYQWPLGVWECPYGHETTWKVPAEEVEAVVNAAFERYKIWRMYADPYMWQSWIAGWAGKYGDKVVIEWPTNRPRQMAAALENFDTSVKTGQVSHSGDSVLRRHLANARRHELPQRNQEGQPLWNIRKDRSDSPDKIDLAMAAVLSWEARTDCIASGEANSGEAGIFVI